MDHKTERQLLRFLMMRRQRGDLPADQARQLEQRLERDSELQSAYRQMTDTWDGLELPELREVPPHFASDVLSAARKIHDHELRWSLAPVWARFGAVMAMLTGLTVGAIFDSSFAEAEKESTAEIIAEQSAEADAVPLSLAEVYWLVLEEGGELFVDESTEGRTR